MATKNLFTNLHETAPCNCFGINISHCRCTPDERVIRNYADGELLPPMSLEQREWAIHEICYCSEGTDRGEVENLSDKDLAYRVLISWMEYVRDKFGY